MEVFHAHIHDHPLSVCVNKQVDYGDGDDAAYMCRVCGLPILSSPSYTCSLCKIFVHKPCAELPDSIEDSRYHSMDWKRHVLNLRVPQSLSDSYTYECEACEMKMHPLHALKAEIKTMHKSHKAHPLVAICRETSCLCDACGEIHTGFFFACTTCNFWIHRDCTVLPSILKIASHPLPFYLSYSLTYVIYYNPECIICHDQLLQKVGLYICAESKSHAHLRCAISNMQNPQSETRLACIQLPADDDMCPSLVIRRYLMSPDDEKKMIVDEKYHKHPLQLIHVDGNGSSSSSSNNDNLVCDVCVQPINTSYYRCLECNFLTHYICVNLLPLSHLVLAWKDGEFFHSPDISQYFFCSIYHCFFCDRPCNGFCYKNRKAKPFDLECSVAPISIKHASHPQHTLFQTTDTSPATKLSCCPTKSFLCQIYQCIVCDDFIIDMRCALLPKRARHKFDNHSLELSYKHDEDDNECYYCEFCEEEIDRGYWYYGCDECGNYFHVKCMPSVGHLSKVKFGQICFDDRIHSHPLALTRMLTVGRNERCGYCNKIIRGLVDEMAFRCSLCDFWIHFYCARESSNRYYRYS